MLEFFCLTRLETKLRHKLLRPLLRLIFRNLLQLGTTFDDGFVEETLGCGHCQQRAHFAATTRLAEDGHIPGSPPKREMLSWTQCNDATMSSMPVFPESANLLPPAPPR